MDLLQGRLMQVDHEDFIIYYSRPHEKNPADTAGFLSEQLIIQNVLPATPRKERMAKKRETPVKRQKSSFSFHFFPVHPPSSR